MWVDVKTGRFLAGDYGPVVTVGKNINGLLLYAWYSFTNTNCMSDPTTGATMTKGSACHFP
jgi:hypothetical protein